MYHTLLTIFLIRTVVPLFYIFTIFLSAFLLFQIQPMISKMILPWFGGSASVWITGMLFFQSALLIGYIYAHLSINNLKPTSQKLMHIFLLGASILLLPAAPNQNLKTLIDVDPILHILYILSISVGMPYFLLSTTSPLLQGWYSQSYSKALPYRFFALSNLSSLIGLLAYPFLVETNLTSSQQSNSWSALYVVFAATCIIAALFGLKTKTIENLQANETVGVPKNESAPPSFMEMMLWLLLSACASVLLLATTNYLTQNIASIPFLWVLPLSLYLLSFILCFDRDGWYRQSWYVWIIASALGAMSYALIEWKQSHNIGIVIMLFCSGLFACCMFCHGELSRRKPSPNYLTSFYLMISIGGAIGGVLVGIIAPKIFAGYFELPIGLAACAFLLLLVNARRQWITDIISVAITIWMIIASVVYIHSFSEDAVIMVRNFYGSLRVNEYNKGDDGEYRSLVHGAITHGIQFQEAERQRKPASYYSQMSGIGLAVKYIQNGPRRIGVIGLGIGTIAAYSRPGDLYRFYEINPLVKEIAMRDFSFISQSSGKVEIAIGDGRLLLERENNQQYDLLVVDAFSGDSIPVHLLTLEAIQLYFRHLKPDGILALHITNSHLNLAPVIEKLSSTLGKQAILISGKGDDEEEIYGTDWALMTANRDLLKIPEIRKAASKLEAAQKYRAWNDNYSNLFQILKDF